MGTKVLFTELEQSALCTGLVLYLINQLMSNLKKKKKLPRKEQGLDIELGGRVLALALTKPWGPQYHLRKRGKEEGDTFQKVRRMQTGLGAEFQEEQSR